MADPKTVQEPETAVQAVPATTPPPAEDPPQAEQPTASDPANICTWEKTINPFEEIVFADGSKFTFPTKIFATADLILSGQINTVRAKYGIEPRSYNYGQE